MDILSSMALFIGYPYLALAPAALFAVLYVISKSRFVLGAGLIWLGYCLYEYGMKFRVLCSGECNIRIDLLFLYPVLILVSLAGIVMFVISVVKRPA